MTSDRRRVAAVVLNWNGGDMVLGCVRSLVEQEPTCDEIVCVDNASTDGSAEVAAAVGGSKLELRRHDERVGMAANWNRCLEAADSEYLLIAHQDDVYEPGFLARMLEVIDGHPRAFMAHSRARTIDEHGALVETQAGGFKKTFWPPGNSYVRTGDDELAALAGGNYIICPSVVLRTSACRTIGRFNENYGFVTDWEYWLRGVLAGYAICGTAEPLVRWRRHAATLTVMHARSLRRFEEEIELLHWLDGSLPPESIRRIGNLFRAARNSLLDEFATRLAAGDRAGARLLARFIAERLPAGAAMPPALLLHALTVGGRPAGRLLKGVEEAWIRMAAARAGAG